MYKCTKSVIFVIMALGRAVKSLGQPFFSFQLQVSKRIKWHISQHTFCFIQGLITNLPGQIYNGVISIFCSCSYPIWSPLTPLCGFMCINFTEYFMSLVDTMFTSKHHVMSWRLPHQSTHKRASVRTHMHIVEHDVWIRINTNHT